jgi:hypothetical protein
MYDGPMGDTPSWVFGGYRIARRVPRPAGMSQTLLPSTLVTASSCIASFVPDAWALDWVRISDQERASSAARVGVGPERLDGLVSLVSEGFAEGLYAWPTVIRSEEGVRRLMSYLPASPEWVVLGLGLSSRWRDAFLESQALPEGAATPGLCELMAAHAPLPPGGARLGFELLGFDVGCDAHSWLCNGLETACAQAIGVTPGPNGLVQSEHEAELVKDHISRDDVGSEPVAWFPWLIVDYTPA